MQRHMPTLQRRPAHLRVYPPAFAEKMVGLHQRFKSKRTLYFGTELQETDHKLSMWLFEKLPWSETDWWHDAAMDSVFIYLRGSKSLQLGSLRPYFPTHIP